MSDEERFVRTAFATLLIVVGIAIISAVGLPISWRNCEDECEESGMRGVYFPRSGQCICTENVTSK
jgi:hypothetical protein